MTYDEFKYKLLAPNSASDAFNSGVKQANSRAKKLVKKILDSNLKKMTKEEAIKINIETSKDVFSEEHGRDLINLIYG